MIIDGYIIDGDLLDGIEAWRRADAKWQVRIKPIDSERAPRTFEGWSLGEAMAKATAALEDQENE